MTTLTAEAVSRRYGDLVAVDEVSIEATSGSVLALLGPNGAGKTTTIDMLAGTTRPDAGRVLWNGAPVEPHRLRQLVGLAPQDAQVWLQLTCGEQLRFLAYLWGIQRREAGVRAERLLDQLGLGPKRDVVAKRLSGGMRRRLNLALALIGDPPAVVLDEPGAGLDPQSRVLVRDVIADLAVDKVVVVSSHDLAEVERLAAQVVIVDHGRVIASGAEDELKRRYGLGQRLEITTTDTDLSDLQGAVQGVLPAGAVRVDGPIVTCRLGAGGDHLARAVAAATASGAAIVSFQTRDDSLEDVFLQLTGRGLRG